MNVKIICTHECTHAPRLAEELRHLGVVHDIVYVEEAPEMAMRYAIRHSPVLVVDDEIVFREQPDETQLREFFQRAEAARRPPSSSAE